MYRAKIYISLKKSVMDPQGATVQHALETLGYEGVENVRMGKYVEMDIFKEKREDAEKQVDEMCDKLLANPVIEKYSFEMEVLK
jgi:phosphoribosylformylglycinamidine synthase